MKNENMFILLAVILISLVITSLVLLIILTNRKEQKIKALRQTIEQQQKSFSDQKLESIGVLAGGVAHEINNPLCGIMNYTQLIMDTNKRESDAWAYANEIFREASRVAKIVKSMLLFSRQNEQNIEEIGIKDVISHTLALVRTPFNVDHINIVESYESDLPSIHCNPNKLRLLFMNLLVNARHALNTDPNHVACF